jgi:hypothetical protein
MAKKKKNDQAPKTRNWLAVRAYLRSGAGAHGKKKYSRKTKHKAAACG